jgi:hypothetical protein
MKSILKILPAILIVVILIIMGCTEKLEEKPRTILTSSYFETAEGIDAGCIAAYSGFRYIYGTEAGMFCTVFGTDEFTHGSDGGSKPINNYDASGLNPYDIMIRRLWDYPYTYINTCNGVIQLGPNAEMNEVDRKRLIAEAKYMRAHYYFNLVQTFGGVTLFTDFNTSPSTVATRASEEEIYEVIVQDLTEAVQDLADIATQPGRVTRPSAIHLLARVYLTRAGTDFAHADDYSNAYVTAKDLIENRARYELELLQDYADVHAEGNEHNSEILWTVERNDDPLYNEINVEIRSNRSLYFFKPNYENVKGLTRTIEYGRSWKRFMPTTYLMDIAFGERVNDARHDKIFQSVWLANDEDDLPEGVNIGDTALWIPGYEMSQAEIDAKPYTVITPSLYTRSMYPSLNKYDDTQRQDIMEASVRPYIVHKLSETYLIAAEAAYMTGNIDDAVEYINVIRRRAAYRDTYTAAELAAAEAAMEISASDVDIDFILDERTRELCGESMRWFDLKRTGKLLERVRLYNPDGGPNIEDHHLLRPIPQTHIDLCSNEYPQNPGY